MADSTRPALMHRRVILTGIAASAATALLAACGGATPSAQPTTVPTTGNAAPAATTVAPATGASAAAPTVASGTGRAVDQLVLGSLEEPGSLSALADLPHHFPEHVAQTLLFDSLTQFMPDSTVAPKLAERWTISPDNLVYTFTLVANAKFHDGQPITAEDVKFTFDAANNPDTKSSNEGLDTVDKVEVVDPRTVRVTLKTLTPMFLAQGGARGIIPKHLLDGKDLSKDDFNKKPVGSGPFKLVSFAPGQSIVMEAVPDYYRGAPSVKRVIIKVLTDQNVILTQLRAGEIQYALITPRDLAAIKGLPVTVVENPTPRFFDIAPNYQRPYWQDQKVREAVLTAIDRQSIVDKVLLGHGKVLDSNVSPISWAFTPDITKHPFDAAKAKSLLDAAGWQAGSDGVREKGGQKLSFGVMLNNFDRTLEQGLLVAQQNLKDVGVTMNVQRVEPGIFGSRRSGKDYDALSRIWNPVYDPDQTSLVKTGNFYGYSNPQVDTLSKQALSTPDRETRKPAYVQIQQILSQEVARLWLYTENELHAVAANLTGMQPHPVNVFWNLKDWKLNG